MNFHFNKQQKSWQNEVQEFLKEHATPELLEETYANKNIVEGPCVKAFRRKMIEKGWNGLTWPTAYGGLNKSALELFIFVEEFNYVGAPMPLIAQMITGPAIIRKGTAENISMWIPQITRGELETSLAYSEPNAGTDLASLQTRAELDGEAWVINGQKIWNSRAHIASHQWAAVRTNPNVPKHKGISVMMIPNDAPGVTIREIKHWGHHRTNEVFFDNVRVPRNYLIGEVDKGWDIITSALNLERVAMGSSAHLRRAFHELVTYCKRTVLDGERLINKPPVRLKMAELAMELDAARLFGMRTALMIDEGIEEISAEASMMKVYATELGTKVSDWGMQIMDLYGQVNKEDIRAPIWGLLEDLYRRAPYQRFGGGTNEIQRNIIAQRGLKLPRR